MVYSFVAKYSKIFFSLFCLQILVVTSSARQMQHLSYRKISSFPSASVSAFLFSSSPLAPLTFPPSVSNTQSQATFLNTGSSFSVPICTNSISNSRRFQSFLSLSNTEQQQRILQAKRIEENMIPFSRSFSSFSALYSTSTSSVEQQEKKKEGKTQKKDYRSRSNESRRKVRSGGKNNNISLVSASYNGFQRFIPEPENIIEKHVVLVPGKARLFKNGNPLVYGGAVAEVHGDPQDGDVVDVVDHNLNFIGWGTYNSQSMYRVRLLCSAYDSKEICMKRDLSFLINTRVEQAIATRKACNLPNQETNIFRLIHGEGDRLSGLVVDVYNDIVVVSSSSLWCELNKDMILETLNRKLKLEFKIKEIVWRKSENRLLQDGYKNEEVENGDNDDGKSILKKNDANEEIEKDFDMTASDYNSNEDEKNENNFTFFDVNQYCVGKENGLQYYISPRKGQKTGFYCDQRENRNFIKSIAKDKNILDLFTYTGAFAMNAAQADAYSVIGVDSSQAAIDTANNNAELNDLDKNKIQFIREDCEKFMERALANGLNYDIVILDPPKLAPNNRALPGAIKKYKKLNGSAMKLVKPNGILLTCTCSSAMTLSGEFMNLISAAAVEAGRHITVLRQSYAACDHTLNPNYVESSYLSAIAVVVH